MIMLFNIFIYDSYGLCYTCMLIVSFNKHELLASSVLGRDAGGLAVYRLAQSEAR